MQVKFALDYDVRRMEFVRRALWFPPELIKEVEPVHLSETARELLANCHPDLPELFDLLSPEVDAGADAEAGHLWALKSNPNAYTAAEVVELWAEEFNQARGESEEVF